MKIMTFQSTYAPIWDAYVHAHPRATVYHLSGWKNIIERTYGHKTYYLMAVNSSKLKAQSSKKDTTTAHQPVSTIQYPETSTQQRQFKIQNPKSKIQNVLGVLPLVHLKHFLLSNSLISMPFFDLGGILANDNETENALLSEAIKLSQDLKAENIELRHCEPLSWLNESSKLKAQSSDSYPMSSPFRRRRIEISQFHQETEKTKISSKSCLPCGMQSIFHRGKSCQTTESFLTISTKSHKVRMLLDLPESSESLMRSFKAKLRSQIRKPMKEGLKSKIGSLELLDDFYEIFSVNMRDLGSPVHSKKLMKNVIEEFPEKARIVVTYKDGQPLACSLVVGFKEILENPWASALRDYSRLSPNMLLYWTMLEYGCNNDYAYFDFGRSSLDEGTYKFKEQWGAKPTPLNWHYILFNGEIIEDEPLEKSRFEKAIQYWQKLPVPVTKVVGPMIRKHIGL